MASRVISSFIFLLSCLLPVESKCPTSFDCGYLGKIQFPWTTTEHTDCGLFVIQGCHDPNVPKTLLTNNGTTRTFKVFRIIHTVSSSESTVVIRDMDLQERLRNRSCEAFSSNYTLPLTLPPPALASFKIRNIGFFFRCTRLNPLDPTNASFFNFTCVDSDIIYGLANPERNKSSSLFSSCSIIQFPLEDLPDSNNPFTFITSMVLLQVRLSDNCSKCLYDRAGHCQLDLNGIFNCDGGDRSRVLKLGLGIGGAIGSVGLVIFGLIVILLRNKQRHKSLESKNQSRSIESDNTHSRSIEYHNTRSNAIQGSRNIYFRVPVLSYEELEEATNKFDQSRQLGRGGFGTVYYGKLKDGREVAVKHLFERNYRGAQQFINEVQILTRLRHRNLVSLYGCTSLACHELLLVYEYISNGTLGGHLHGNLSKPGSLPWPVRMRIAIETANGLSYLHACGIIHRDVKSSNLLLDDHFCVKVADFGISRLFPMFASHVSTAPAGTPGYLDPEYYQFCKLTEKSDVYSFGVVLIELISSKPAIFTRTTDKINLANMAVKKIQRSAFSELVDPSLGFESDDEVREMIISVAKLAFRCLQRDVELRPSMGEVMEFLQKIENGNYDLKRLEFHGAGFPKREIYTSLPTSVHRDGDASFNNSEPQHPPRTV